MIVNNKHFESIWWSESNAEIVSIIDQRLLPFKFVVKELRTVQDVYYAIKDMHLRGAPLIGAAAAWGMYLAVLNSKEINFEHSLKEAASLLKSSRPTAINLAYAVDRSYNQIMSNNLYKEQLRAALSFAKDYTESEKKACRKIGLNGLPIIEEISQRKNGEVVNILTHCNAGWLACIDYGTATAPIYAAHDKGIKVHVWIDETRPRNQGSRLTAWELGQHGVPCTIIADNTGGHLMQHGQVDICIVGSDRTTAQGDVANKIGTYLKALAAFDNNIPFYVALPTSSIDLSLNKGISEIPIEIRDSKEMELIEGISNDKIVSVNIMPKDSKSINYAFDVTPSRLVTKLITERGNCYPNSKEIAALFK